MVLIAVLAAALAASCGAAVSGLAGRGPVVPILYGVGVAAGALGALRWPARRPLRLPHRRVAVGGWGVERAPVAMAAAAALGIVVLGATEPSLATVVGLLLLLVPAVAVLWPRPGALTASVVLSGSGLLSPAAPLAERPSLVVGFVVGAAVALGAAARLSHDLLPRLGAPGPGRERRVLAGAAVMAAVAVLGGALAVHLVPPQASGGGGTGRRARSSSSGAGAPYDDSITLRQELDVTGAKGPASRSIVLRVEAARPDVWRTQTFDAWDGRGWARSADLATREVDPPGPGTWRQPLASTPGGAPSTQRFTVEAPFLTVFAAAPVVVELRSRASLVEATVEDAIPTRPEALVVQPRAPLRRGATYEADSRRLDASEDDLRSADQDTAGMVAGRWAPYVRAGDTSARSRALAAEVTAGAPTSYDKARALERWLSDNVRLDRTGRAVGDGTDLVDRVLFVDRSATADRLATALTLLLRSLGIPARLGVGFLAGPRSLLDGRFVVRRTDAHTWVEVGFGGRGWERFDPSGRIAQAERADSLPARLLRLLRQLAPVLAVVALTGAGLAAWLLLRRRRERRALPWANRFWTRLVRAGDRRGRPRQVSETPAEYASALAASELPDDRLHEVGAILSAAAFSGREPPPETRSWAEGVLDDAVRAGRAAGGRHRIHRRRRGTRTGGPH